MHKLLPWRRQMNERSVTYTEEFISFQFPTITHCVKKTPYQTTLCSVHFGNANLTAGLQPFVSLLVR